MSTGGLALLGGSVFLLLLGVIQYYRKNKRRDDWDDGPTSLVDSVLDSDGESGGDSGDGGGGDGGGK